MRRSDFALLPFCMDVAVAMSQLMVNLRALDLGASAGLVGVLLGLCWGLPYLLGCLTTGATVARFGARPLMIVGSLVFAVGTFLYGLAPHPWVLLAAAPLGGLGSALFWPAFQTYLHSADPQETRARTGIFNVSWTIGVLTGAGVGGHTYDLLGPRWCFFALAALIGVLALYIAVRVGIPEPLTEEEETALAAGPVPPPAVVKACLRTAWIGNFALWFAGSLATAIFPRLARSVGLDDGTIGEVTAVVWIGQAGTFAWLTATRAWHYRTWPVVAGLLCGLAGTLLMGVGAGALAFAAAYLLLGTARSPSHLASVKYGLEAGPAYRAANMGYHEAILGGGFVLGPLVAGAAADQWGLRAPFWVAACVLVTAGVLVAIRQAALRRQPVRGEA